MKRCPKCEFTFDDQREFCDFDGAELSVLPEVVLSLKDCSKPAASPSLFRRVVRSRITLAGLSLVAVTLSALMIGYYDAANLPVSVSGPNLEHGEQVQVNTSSQGPAYVTMERRVTSAREASSMPSSTIKWLADDSESQPSESGPMPTTFRASRVQANTRRLARSNSQSLANNQKSVSRNKLAHDPASQGTRRQKDSRVVAILKKTGSILTWPFKL